MAKKTQLKSIQSLLTKDRLQILEDYHELIQGVNGFLQAAGASVAEICKVADVSESQYHRRRNNPELWQRSELIKIFKYFK